MKFNSFKRIQCEGTFKKQNNYEILFQFHLKKLVSILTHLNTRT